MITLPSFALSVRQPWAWAIVMGHKPVENRGDTFALTKGDVPPLNIAIHAAQGMTQAEYEDAAEFMANQGVTCPRPDDLVRGAIVGAAKVIAVVANHPSAWFFGPRGLVLADAHPVEPIPAGGKLGYFRWAEAGAIAAPLPWMRAWPNKAARAAKTARPSPADLFSPMKENNQ